MNHLVIDGCVQEGDFIPYVSRYGGEDEENEGGEATEEAWERWG